MIHVLTRSKVYHLFASLHFLNYFHFCFHHYRLALLSITSYITDCCFYTCFWTSWDWNKDTLLLCCGFPGGSVVENTPANAGDAGSIPGLGRSPGGWKGNPLQHSGLKNPMDWGAWWAAVHEVKKRWTMTEHTHILLNSIQCYKVHESIMCVLLITQKHNH